MISVAEALTHILSHRPKDVPETVNLRSALGLRLMGDVFAKLTQPPLDASAMDGYAVRLMDIRRVGAVLKLIGEAPAGAPFKGKVAAGEAVRIFTGGAIPEGANTIIIQENVTAAKGFVNVTEPQNAPHHIRHAGLDFRQGQILIKSGTLLGSPEIAIAAASGHAELSVARKRRVAILSCGDELVAPDETPKIGQIINSNPYALAALIESWGHEAIILPTAVDTRDSITKSLNCADNADAIIPVGGASVGDHDHMRAAFTDAGLRMIFEKVAVRPGKPTWFGMLHDRPVLGLPGNPASAIVCAQLFARPLLTGNKAKFIHAKLSEAVPANGPRETYQRAVVSPLPDGSLSVRPLPLQDSSLMMPFMIANGLMKLAANQTEKSPDDLVEVTLIKHMI